MPKVTSVSPERLEGWLRNWSDLHHGVTVQATDRSVTLMGNDDQRNRLVCDVPFPPMTVRSDRPYAGMLDHVRLDRLVAVILVRRGGYAVGVFDGRRLVQSKVGSGYVQGKTKAGGWSQQRFARRRENQARKLYESAAEAAARVLEPYRSRLDALVLGGDRQGSTAVLDDDRLRAFRALLVERRLTDVPDPKAAVLARTPNAFRAVRIEIHDEAAHLQDSTDEPTVDPG